MCATCGCSDGAGVRVTAVGAARATTPSSADPAAHPDDHPGDHPHHHPHDGHSHDAHAHGHGHGTAHPLTGEVASGQTVLLEQNILAKNDHLADHNRGWLAARDLVAVNLMSAPGSGKTTLLERTIRDLRGVPLAVIEGDQETLFDAERIQATGCPVVQINTGAGCHLDADMTARGLRALDPAPGSTIIVENVGNLVCPALFDLGETARAVIMSTTEGPDKPRKYPQMFVDADLILINKIDLLPYLAVTLAEITESVHAVNPRADVLAVSATRGDGMDAWFGWLENLHRQPAAPLDSLSTHE